jgi:plasmid stabilization system protein ParE
VRSLCVDEYRLTAQALRDLDDIRQYLQRTASVEVADNVELALFEAFDELVLLSWIGHRREDIRPSRSQFYNVFSYVIAFHREPRVVIERITHGARDLSKLL